jgi:hypothetical protein
MRWIKGQKEFDDLLRIVPTLLNTQSSSWSKLREAVYDYSCNFDYGRVNHATRPDLSKFPVNFPVSREIGAETGAISTGPPTSQSGLRKYGSHQRGKPRYACFFGSAVGLQTPEFGADRQ